MDYEYSCVEIISKKKMIEYAKVRCHDFMNFYMNQNDNFIFTEHRGQKHNVFEVTEFDKKTGESTRMYKMLCSYQLYHLV